VQLSTFVAVHLTRVLTINPKDLDICLLGKRLKNVEDHLQIHDDVFVRYFQWLSSGKKQRLLWQMLKPKLWLWTVHRPGLLLHRLQRKTTVMVSLWSVDNVSPCILLAHQT